MDWGVSMSVSGQYQTGYDKGSATVYRSTNYGATWSVVTSALPTSNVIWESISVNSTGQYQTICSNNDTLSSIDNGFIWTSKDYGVTWINSTAYLGSKWWMSVAIALMT